MRRELLLARYYFLKLSIGHEGAEGNERGHEEVDPESERPLEFAHAQGKQDAVGDEENSVNHTGYLDCFRGVVKILEGHGDSEE